MRASESVSLRRRTAAVTLVAVAGLSAIATADTGQIIVVPDDQPFLGVALAVAQCGDTIRIKAGTYSEATEYVVSAPITIQAEPPGAAVTLSGSSIHRVMRIDPAGTGTVIEGIRFENGFAPDAGDWGGGLYADDADVTLRDCVFESNTAVQAGGGLASNLGDITLEDCLFRSNTVTSAGSDGGAIFATAGGVVGGNSYRITDCRFELNHAENTAGAVRLDWGIGQVTSCVFDGNSSNELAGAVWLRSSADVTIDHCEFTSNTAVTEGGAIRVIDAGTVCRVRNSVFRGNEALASGGAIHTGNALTEITNCTFVENIAASAAALGRDAGPSPLLTNSIVWGNLPATGQVVTGAIVRFALVEGAYAGGQSVIDSPPGFVDLAGGNLRLLAGSPAIDAGSTDLYVGPMIDLDGSPRGVEAPATMPKLGESVIGPIVDLGAYEFQTGVTPGCAADSNGDSFVDVTDLLKVLADWGACP
jgi:predicted outer membrane repeat protein